MPIKKIFIIAFIIIVSIFTLNGCYDTRDNFITGENEVLYESLEQQPNYNITASEALNMLYDSFKFNERGTRDYPDDYAGYYLDGDFGQDNYVLAVMITDENSTRYDFLKGYEKVRFETAEHSLNELWEIRAQLPSELIKELELPYMGAQINMQKNIIELTFEDTCSNEQRAVITEYAAGKPLTVGYAEKNYPVLD